MRNYVPASWKSTDLDSVAVVTSGQSPPGSTYNTAGDGLPFFQGKAEFGKISPTPVKWCSAPLRIAHPGDVLISVRAPVGPTNLTDTECCIGRGLAAITPLGAMPSKFYLYYLRFSVEALVRHATGTTFQAISGKQLRAHEVLVPPLPEQQRIVEAIESYLTRLDNAVASLERVQRNLERYRASVLKAAVEGRLVPTEAELARKEGRDYEPASELLKRILAARKQRWIEDTAEKARAKAEAKALKAGKPWTREDDAVALPKARKTAEAKYRDPAPPDLSALQAQAGTADLPDLPKGWCWTTMDAITVSGPQNGIYVHKSLYGDGTPILRIDDYQVDLSRSADQFQRVILSDQDCRRYSLRVGDLVINRVNSPSHLGKSMVVESRHVPAVFESNMMRLELAERMDAFFVQAFLSSASGKTRLTQNAKWAVNQASINQGDVGRTAIPLPPASEQWRVVTELKRIFSISEDVRDTMFSSSAKSESLRQSILKWAFEGKLVEQDPNDEPASALLERIRAQRTRTKGGRDRG